ncbi:MAG: hypothetical protein KKB30_12960 [Proteobacteria bacterium]|nr:hypothetical protein [Pseudomonadota bacterium]MBU1714879.1 hypothetical protein [Pseudomonadota bacterium]
MIKTILAVGIVLGFSVLSSFSSNFEISMQAMAANESFGQDVHDFMQDGDNDFKEFDEDAKKEVQSFIEEADRDFAEFLKDDWQEFIFEQPTRLIEKPKPVVKPFYKPAPQGAKMPPTPIPIIVDIPVFSSPKPVLPPAPVKSVQKTMIPSVDLPGEPTPSAKADQVIDQPFDVPIEKPSVTEPVVIAKPQPTPVKTPAPVPVPEVPAPVAVIAPVVPPVVPVASVEDLAPDKSLDSTPSALAEAAGTELLINFFGSDLVLRYDPRLDQSIPTPIDNNRISAYWEKMAAADFKMLIRQTGEYKKQLQMNDWGYFLFLNMLAEKVVSSGRESDRNLFVWFMMTKSGYETKIGYMKDKIQLLVPSDGGLYGLYFFKIKGHRYYAITTTPRKEGLGKIFTYQGKYPGADTSMNFALRQYPALSGKTRVRELSFNYEGREYTVKAQINENSISYFQYYPQNEANIYAMAPMPSWMEDSLLSQLRPMLKGRPERDAVNFLLRFSQKVFEYKTDKDQFDREKFMFPEETVFYPYSDCEDRAIFFSYLVKNLLGLKVVLLNYPNHMATAVKLSQPEGEQIIVNGTRFTICDPTYINADIGKSMPQNEGVTPEVFFL